MKMSVVSNGVIQQARRSWKIFSRVDQIKAERRLEPFLPIAPTQSSSSLSFHSYLNELSNIRIGGIKVLSPECALLTLSYCSTEEYEREAC
jgi:hypothetical protein